VRAAEHDEDYSGDGSSVQRKDGNASTALPAAARAVGGFLAVPGGKPVPPDWGKKVQRLRPSLASARRGGEERDPGFVVKTTPLGPGQMDSGAGENGGVKVQGESVNSSCPWRVVPTTPRPPASASAGADTTPGVATPAVVSAPALATPEASSSSQLFSARLFLWPEMHALAALQGSPLTLGVGGSGGGSRGRKAGGSRRGSRGRKAGGSRQEAAKPARTQPDKCRFCFQ